MTREQLPTTPNHESVISLNETIIADFQREYADPAKIGIGSLSLIDQETGQPTRTLEKCNSATRKMLDELYARLGIDTLNSTLRSSTQLNKGLTYRSEIHSLGDGTAIRERQIISPNLHNFAVEIGHEALFK